MKLKEGRKGGSEEKFVKLAQVFYPPLKALDGVSIQIVKLGEEITAEVCGIYADKASMKLAAFI